MQFLGLAKSHNIKILYQVYILGLFSNPVVVEFCAKWICIMWGPGLALKATKMASQMVTQMAVGLINIHFISVEQKR